MGLFDFFKGDYPSRRWVANPNMAIEIDLDEHELCGINLGSPIDMLQGLGPASSAENARVGLFEYPALGLNFTADDNALESFTASWDNFDKLRPYTGSVRAQGKIFQINENTTESQFTAFFGEPYWREVIEGSDTTLYYEHLRHMNPIEWQVNFNEDERISYLTVTSDIMMDCQQTREDIGCDRPWPPAYE